MLARLLLFLFISSTALLASPTTITNSSFEADATAGEFTLTTPTGWTSYTDPAYGSDFSAVSGVFLGTLNVTGFPSYYNDPTPPDGNLVAIIYNQTNFGATEFGIEQTLSDTLAANTQYTLTVEVGNIGSGTSNNGAGDPYNLDGFPGYRIELLADGVVLDEDDNSLVIPEREFATATIPFSTGLSHTQLGQSLGIRLISLNSGNPSDALPATIDANEVNFDNVRLTATAIPEPRVYGILSGTLALLLALRRRTTQR